MSDRLIEHLHPDLRPLYKLLVQDLAAKVITARLIQGWRDPAYQDKLHAQGISPLTGLKSKHCFTLLGQPAAKAFDLGVFNADGSYAVDGNDVRYTIAGGLWRQYAASHPGLRLEWGGSWSHGIDANGKPYDHRDWDHFQIG